MFVEVISKRLAKRKIMNSVYVAIAGDRSTGKLTFAILLAIDEYRKGRIDNIYFFAQSSEREALLEKVRQYHPDIDPLAVKTIYPSKEEIKKAKEHGEFGDKFPLPSFITFLDRLKHIQKKSALIIPNFCKQLIPKPLFTLDGEYDYSRSYYDMDYLKMFANSAKRKFTIVISTDIVVSEVHTFVKSYTSEVADVTVVCRYSTSVIGRVYGCLVKAGKQIEIVDHLHIHGGKLFSTFFKNKFNQIFPAIHKEDVSNLVDLFDPEFE